MAACTYPKETKVEPGDVTSLPVLSQDTWGRSRLYD